MIARPRTGPALSIEDREMLDGIQEILRRIERAPDTTLPRANARALARTLTTRKYRRISKHRADAYGPASQDIDILEALGGDQPRLLEVCRRHPLTGHRVTGHALRINRTGGQMK